MSYRIILEAAQPAINIDSKLINGSKLRFYDYDSLLPAPVYTSHQLTTAMGNEVVANNGFFPDMWAHNEQAYRVEWLDAQDNILRVYDRIDAGTGKDILEALGTGLSGLYDDVNEALSSVSALEEIVRIKEIAIQAINTALIEKQEIASEAADLADSARQIAQGARNATSAYKDAVMDAKTVVLENTTAATGAAEAAALSALQVETALNDTVTGLASKASVQSVNDLTARVGTAEGQITNYFNIKASQEYVDGQLATKLNTSSYNSFVSSYNSWKSGIDNFSTAQLDINTNLQGQISGKASTSSLNSAVSRIGDAESAINTLQTTTATADAANANAIATVSAKLDVAPNLFPYPRPKNLTDAPSSYGWFADIWAGSGAYSINYSAGDSFWKGSYYYMDRIQANAPATVRAARFNLEPLQCGFGAIYANKPITVSARAYMAAIAGDSASVYLLVIDTSGNIIGWADTPNLPINTSIGIDKRQSWTFNFSSLPQNPIPANAYKLALVVRHDLSATGSSPPYQFLGFTDIKIEFGSVATAYTNEANNNVLQATIVDTKAIAIDAKNGAYALFGTQSVVNGRTGGFIVDNNGVVIGFQITADTFAFKTPSAGNKTLFGYDGTKFFFTTDVKVGGNLLIDGSVNNQKIADGSIGNVQSWRTANSYQPTANNTWYNVGSLPITATGKLIKVEFGCFGWANTLISSNAQNGISLRIRRDSTTLFNGGLGIAKIITVGEVQFVQEYNNGFSFAVLDIPAAGIHTYYLDILANNKDYAGISYPYIILQEFIKL